MLRLFVKEVLGVRGERKRRWMNSTHNSDWIGMVDEGSDIEKMNEQLTRWI
jgi:hypothetical protein